MFVQSTVTCSVILQIMQRLTEIGRLPWDNPDTEILLFTPAEQEFARIAVSYLIRKHKFEPAPLTWHDEVTPLADASEYEAEDSVIRNFLKVYEYTSLYFKFQPHENARFKPISFSLEELILTGESLRQLLVCAIPFNVKSIRNAIAMAEKYSDNPAFASEASTAVKRIKPILRRAAGTYALYSAIEDITISRYYSDRGFLLSNHGENVREQLLLELADIAPPGFTMSAAA